MAFTYSATETDASMAHGNPASTASVAFNTDIDTLGTEIETQATAGNISEAEANQLNDILQEFTRRVGDSQKDQADA